MRLATVYIPKNSLPYIFGEGHTGQTINLGGEYFYSFSETDYEIKIENKVENKHFFSHFYETNISLISTIVGQNGVGKSTILRALNHSIDPSSKKLVYIFEFEKTAEIQIYNNTVKTILCSDDLRFSIIEKKLFEPLYYSPCLDYDLIDARSPIALIYYLDSDIESYFLDSVSRNVSFLHDQVLDSIKEVYHDFPSYDGITVKAKNHRKSFFRATYLEANFGTPHRGDALKNEINGELSKLEDPTYGKDAYSRDELIMMMKDNVRLLDSESFTELFTKLWNIDEYKFVDHSGYDYIHDNENFLKNIEITILSYLLVGATFPQTGLGGGLDFNKIIDADSFKDRLNLFLELYLVNEEKILTEKIKEEVGIDIEKYEEIVGVIKKDKISQTVGVDLIPIKNRMISDIEGFGAIYYFYNKLEQFCDDKNIIFDNKGLFYNIKDIDTKILFDELILSYKYILKSFPQSPITKSFLEFIPNKKLSTGEKAILDFYSSLYAYIDVNKESKHLNYEYFLLLLDEPDLGFHPLWKKKFVKAISSTLPILFSKMTPHVYDGQKNYIKVRENPLLQIIFTTHDPLTLSDVPNTSVVYLKKEHDYSRILENDDIYKMQKTFGANVHELLSDSFFIEDGLMGEFAKKKIQDLVLYLTFKDDIPVSEDNKNSIEQWDKNSALKLIEIVGEPVIRERLQALYDIKFNIAEKEALKARIMELQKKLNKLDEKDFN
ncbi:AAA family ATPase [Chryseobacterium sp. M5A1_1a]